MTDRAKIAALLFVLSALIYGLTAHVCPNETNERAG